MKAHMICHTHWDREWYFTREEFRTKLVRLIDGLLDVIDRVPEYVSFMLDGQTIAIEDYLEIKPWKKEKLYQALESGKIICGPWYILPDELLISGESHIRNYLIGGSVLAPVNTKMKTAYLPDSFGHPAQMPQIVDGLGMDTMVFWRGTANFVEQTEFYWNAPVDGVRTLCIHMPCGYGNCGNLSGTDEEIYQRVKEMVETLEAKSSTDIVLLMNGSDHITGQENIADIVRMLNSQNGEFQVELSTLERLIGELKENLPELKSYGGEFRYSERSMLLGGTLSTRMYLKQKNYRVQKAMEQYLEPLWAAEYLLGGQEDTKGYQNYLWKKILENHPHDSICGCSIDEVHREMETRFACVEQLETILTADAMKRIQRRLANPSDGKELFLLLFEPSQDSQPSYAETEIELDKMLVQEVNFAKSIIVDYEDQLEHPPVPESIRITDEQGREIPYIILEAGKGYSTRYQDHTMPEVYKANCVKVGMLLPAFDYGLHTLKIEKVEKSREESVPQKNADSIENEFYRVFFEGEAFTVIDKKSGRCHRGVNRFIDKGDAGDEYTYSWPYEDQVYTLDKNDIKIQVKGDGKLRAELQVSGRLMVPESLTEDRRNRSEALIACPVTVTASLTAGIDRIDFDTSIDNRAKDHRIQLQFPSGIRTDVSHAEDIFHITERKIEREVPEVWAEYPQSTHPCHGFINVEDESGGMSILAQGITEFEGAQTEDGTCLNLTLLRCVGWLSRTDLLTRQGNGGWTIETPEAQCLGTYHYHYSAAYHAGSYQDSGVYAVLNKASKPAVLQQLEVGNGALDVVNCLGFLSKLPENIRVSALKPAEDGEGIVLRLYNIGSADCAFSLMLPSEIQKVYTMNLAEEREEELSVEEKQLKLLIKASQIATIKLTIR